MGLRGRVSRLEKISADAAIDAFFRRLDGRRGDPAVAAAAAEVGRVLDEADAAAGRRLAPSEWLDLPGVDEAMDRLFFALNACDGS